MKISVNSGEYTITIDTENLPNYIENLSFNIKNCYFAGFNNEYLFCCAYTDIITCKREDPNFNLINSFIQY